MTETVKTAMTTEGRTSKNWPVSPGTKSRGMKAMMLVETAKKTGMTMSFAPLMAAEMRDSPLEMRWKISSPTTTASSTTMPRVMMNPKREIMLIVEPPMGSRAMEPRMEMGMPMAVQKATRRSRKRPRASRTRTSPIAPFCMRRVMRSRNSTERSRERVRETESGRVFWRASMNSRTAPATSSGAWLSALKTEMVTERLP